MSDRPIKLLLIDDDPIFRLGLVTALATADVADIQVIAQAETAAAALEIISGQFPNLVLLELELGRFSGKIAGLSLCLQLKRDYPDLPILLLTTQADPQQLLAAKAAGVEGYCLKGAPLTDLIAAIRQVAAGKASWPSMTANLPLASQQKWLFSAFQSGLEQIDESLAKVRHQLEKTQLSLVDWLFWKGRQRELLAARWLVNQLSPGEIIVFADKSQSIGEERKAATQRLPLLPAAELPPIRFQQPATTARVFGHTLGKIQSGLKNLTGIPLEIDILQEEKKRELLYLVLNEFGKILEELRFLKITAEELPQRRSLILRDLWQSSTLDFLSKYYTPTGETTEVILVDILLQEIVVVQEEILEKIAFFDEVSNYFLFEIPLKIDNVTYRLEAPEVINRAEILLEDLIIQISNAVMQVILNNFAEVEAIKQNLYKKEFLSSRQIATFRNQLSWKYRLEQYWEEPKAIFESQYRLFVLNGNSISKISLYSPRQEELEQLRGIPWTVTIALEIRDAIAPGLRTIVAFIGNGLVYLLTQVIGRGIGLIGRGIIQGIGNTLQDVRYGKNRE